LPQTLPVLLMLVVLVLQYLPQGCLHLVLLLSTPL
jgi:hypothetical protein